MGDPSVIIALLVVAVVGGLIAGRLQRAAKRGRADGAEPRPAEDPTAGLSASDQRFRLLSFQGGPIPADLGRMVEDLRRNGIEVDEATLRQKLADGVVPLAGTQDGRPIGSATAGTAIVLGAADLPGGEAAPDTVPVLVTLELRLPEREPIREQRVAVIAGDKRALLVEGASVPVLYDAGDPRAITLEWEIT